jgi:cytochrome P450
VIKEAMRFWTVIPNIARSASEDFELGGWIW